MANYISTQVNFNKSSIGELQIGNSDPGACVSNDAAKPEGVIESDGGLNPHLCYNPSGDPAKILIISNDKCEDNPLPGYKEDAKNLETMWENFGCEVIVHKNLEWHEMRSHITTFAKHILNGSERFCGVFIMSHGYYLKEQGDIVYGTDEGKTGYLVVDNILGMFDNKQNEKLHGVPKFFVFQCCRGGNMPQAVISKGAAAAGGDKTSEKIPHISDTIIMYATQPKNVSIVDEDGSWLIKAILEIFPKYADSEHLADMLTMVNGIVSREIVKKAEDQELVGVKCMSEIRSTLLYKLKLK